MRRLPPILLVLLCMLMPLTAWAMPMLRASADQVRAGETLTIEWSRLPAGTHEVELELSLDGGRWLRISPELEAHEGRFVWTVPAGLSGTARVRLRYGREHEEHEGGMVALELPAPEHAPVPGALLAAGDWWNVGHPSTDAPLSDLGEGASLAPAMQSLHALPSPTTGIAVESAPAPAFDQVLPAEPGHSLIPRAFTPPRSTPLRN